jgi:tyrosyl-DNA phosphodiesterase-1
MPPYTSLRLSLIFLTATYENLHSWFPSYLCKWEGKVGGRQKIMPHYKSYTRLRVQSQDKIDAADSEIEARASIAWHLVTSANLSRAAWGDVQKNGAQLHIRHYELGILLYPDLWEVKVYDKALSIET